MKKRLRLPLLLYCPALTIALLTVGETATAAEAAFWRAGVAKVKITPQGPCFAAGYGGEKRIATDRHHDLWIKVLALEDARGQRGLLVTSDPMQAWKLGTKTLWVALSGEPLVHYALTLQRQYGPDTLVTGYCSDLMAYIPTRRIWEEARGEEVMYLWEYGRPAYRWAGDVEPRIIAAVEQMARTLEDQTMSIRMKCLETIALARAAVEPPSATAPTLPQTVVVWRLWDCAVQGFAAMPRYGSGRL